MECFIRSLNVRDLGARTTYDGGAAPISAVTKFGAECGTTGKQSRHDAATNDHWSANANYNQGRWTWCDDNAADTSNDAEYDPAKWGRSEWDRDTGDQSADGHAGEWRCDDLCSGERYDADWVSEYECNDSEYHQPGIDCS